MRRTTIKDVAREAGLSPSAVSRVFTAGASASEATRRKVLEAADRLGYRPSLLARGLVARRTNLVTLAVGELGDPFDAMFVQDMARILAARGARAIIVSTAQDEAALLDALDYQSDAVVVAAGTMSLGHSDICAKAGLPIILAGRVLDSPAVDCALADNVAAGGQAAELLMRVGCRRLAYLGRAVTTYSDSERFKGFSEAAAQAGLVVVRQDIPGRDVGDAVQAATSLLTRGDRPDAIFCNNDLFAIGALEAARSLGLAVPAELCLVGFNDIPAAGWRSFRLTTMRYPVPALVGEVMSLLDRRLADPSAASLTRRIPTDLIVRATTREIAA